MPTIFLIFASIAVGQAAANPQTGTAVDLPWVAGFLVGGALVWKLVEPFWQGFVDSKRGRKNGNGKPGGCDLFGTADAVDVRMSMKLTAEHAEKQTGILQSIDSNQRLLSEELRARAKEHEYHQRELDSVHSKVEKIHRKVAAALAGDE